MAWWIRTLAIYKFEDPNSDPSTHSNKPGMVSGAPITRVLKKDEAGGLVGLTDCQPRPKGESQVQGTTLSQVDRQRVMEEDTQRSLLPSAHRYMSLDTHTHT